MQQRLQSRNGDDEQLGLGILLRRLGRTAYK